jgi:hypothetical protein
MYEGETDTSLFVKKIHFIIYLVVRTVDQGVNQTKAYWGT